VCVRPERFNSFFPPFHLDFLHEHPKTSWIWPVVELGVGVSLPFGVFILKSLVILGKNEAEFQMNPPPPSAFKIMGLNVILSTFPKSWGVFLFVSFLSDLDGSGAGGTSPASASVPLSRKCLSWLLCPTGDPGAHQQLLKNLPKKDPIFLHVRRRGSEKDSLKYFFILNFSLAFFFFFLSLLRETDAEF